MAKALLRKQQFVYSAEVSGHADLLINQHKMRSRAGTTTRIATTVVKRTGSI
jgi:hypothetical protein